MSTRPKGTQVNRTPRSAPIPFLRTGIVAALRGVFRGGGGSGAGSEGAVGRGGAGLRSAGLLALTITALFALTATSAQAAAPTYQFSPAKTEKLSKTLAEGTGGPAFGGPETLTFDAAGNLYVADEGGQTGESIIDKFDDENAFLAQLGEGALHFNSAVAVNDETGHVFATYLNARNNEGAVVVLNAAGTQLSRWEGAATPSGAFGEGVSNVQTAVDNSTSSAHGDIYVDVAAGPGPGADQVYVFASKNGDTEEGEYLRSLELPPGGFTLGGGGLAVDDSSGATAGRVYVTESEVEGGLNNRRVDYFSPTGTYEGSIEGPSATERFEGPTAVAVDPATGDLFVVDSRNVYEFDPSGALLATISQAAGKAIHPRGVAVMPTGPGAGDLYVSNEGQGGERSAVDVFEVRHSAAPTIEAVGATGVTDEGATLLTEIDPQGEPTTYRLEYGACASPTSCALAPFQVIAEGALGSAGDFSVHTVSVSLSGLSPGTTYHLRATATNGHGPTIGTEGTFTTQGPASFALPDGRGYELVSPVAKHGGVIEPIGEVGTIEAAADGSAIAYLANSPTEAQPEGNAGTLIQTLSRRGPSGWAGKVIASPHRRVTGANGEGSAPENRLFAADLSAALIQPSGLFNPELSPEATEQTPYLHDLGPCSGSCYRPLVSAANTPEGTHFGEEWRCEEEHPGHPGGGSRVVAACGPELLGATPDLAHAVIESPAPLTPTAPTGRFNNQEVAEGFLYEWSRATGSLQLISLLPPNGSGEELPPPPGAARLGNKLGLAGGSARRAISGDGSRVFWSSGGNLYLRDTEPGHEQTLELDTAEEACLQAGECESGGGVFQIASTDGSRAFFTDGRKLTTGSGAESSKADLYECRIVENLSGRLECDLTDLTPETPSGESAGVQANILGASEDGSYLYFAARGVLASNLGADGTHAAPATCLPEEASAICNLYLAHDGAVSFLATLSGADEANWSSLPRSQPTRVSPDGRWLAFMSQRPLTGYDNHDAASGRPDAEVFLYDAATGRLACASCDPGGARPVGIEYRKLEAGNRSLATVRGQWPSSQWVAALVPQGTSFESEHPGYQSRWLSDSGRLFFNALGGLVPADSNGIGDVYEFEQPQGPGQPASNSCTTSASTYVPSSGACLDLISSGTGTEGAAFLDASESGDDVFFLTSQKLVGKDVDSAPDVYDARVGGGEPEVVKPVECSGDACQQPATPPVDATPGSLTFQGAGNVVECPKGKQLKKGKCLKQQQKKKHHKKHGKKSKRKAGTKSSERTAGPKRGAGG